MSEKKDQSGATVKRSRSGSSAGRRREGRGVFVGPGEADRAAAVRSTLARLRTEPRSLSRGTNLAQRFQWFLAPALLLILLDTFLTTRRGRRRGLSAVATAASSVMLMFANGCAGTAVREKEAIQLYNRGTALIEQADSLTRAGQVLRRAETIGTADVSFRSAFNAGYIHLRDGLRLKGDSAAMPLDSALAVYRRALTLRPDDIDASEL